jgi:hypothetical protein
MTSLVVKASLLLSGLLIWGMLSPLHAEGICPPGMFSTNPAGAQGPVSCAPIPNYAQNPGQATAPQAPQLPPERWQDHWGAIVTDPVKSILGTAVNMTSKSQAEKAAFAECQSKGGTTCKLDIAYLNECAVMVAGNTGYNTKAGATINDAAQAAMKVCNAATSNCHSYYTACSLPVRIQ